MRTDADVCRDLAHAVLAKALQDALSDINGQAYGVAAARPSAKERAEARAFCLDVDGEWARSRMEWCDAAGECPRRYAAKARRLVIARMNEEAARGH